MYDIIVIGAGISGSVAARLCAENGLSVLLLEQQEYPGKNSVCGGLFSKKYFNQFVNNSELLEQEIDRTDFYFPWAQYTYEEKLVTVSRHNLDAYLAEKSEESGVDLQTSTRVNAVKQSSNREIIVSATNLLKKEDVNYRSRFCIFADGPFSLADKNQNFGNNRFNSHWSFAYVYELDGLTFEPNVCKIFIDANLVTWGYGWIFPNKNKMNSGLGTVLSMMKKNVNLKERMDYFLNNYSPTAKYFKECKILKKRGGFIPMVYRKQNFKDNIFVIGDAAGMVTSMFGAGIDNAFKSAIIISNLFLEIVKKNRPYSMISRAYHENIEKEIGQEMKKQNLISRIIVGSRFIHHSLPVKLLSIIGFGNQMSRWSKVKLLFYPYVKFI